MAILSLRARQVSSRIDDMAQSLARGQVVCEYNSEVSAEIMNISNDDEKLVLLDKYKDAVGRMAIQFRAP